MMHTRGWQNISSSTIPKEDTKALTGIHQLRYISTYEPTNNTRLVHTLTITGKDLSQSGYVSRIGRPLYIKFGAVFKCDDMLAAIIFVMVRVVTKPFS